MPERGEDVALEALRVVADGIRVLLVLNQGELPSGVGADADLPILGRHGE